MKHILSRRHREVLVEYARSKVLLAFDYDGTLSPIVRDPAKARMRARTKQALERVAGKYPTAVISGRSRGEVTALLGNVPLVAVLGNHGLEPSDQMDRYVKIMRTWLDRLSVELREVQGVSIEDKTYSLAIHYRKSNAQLAAVRRIRRAAGLLGKDARLIGGKCVINVVHAQAPHKGRAVQRLQTEQGTDAAIFVGDDLTDEDVFALSRPKLLGIRVGRSAGTSAAYYIRDQKEMDELLVHLASLRV